MEIRVFVYYEIVSQLRFRFSHFDFDVNASDNIPRNEADVPPSSHHRNNKNPEAARMHLSLFNYAHWIPRDAIHMPLGNESICQFIYSTSVVSWNGPTSKYRQF